MADDRKKKLKSIRDRVGKANVGDTLAKLLQLFDTFQHHLIKLFYYIHRLIIARHHQKAYLHSSETIVVMSLHAR